MNWLNERKSQLILLSICAILFAFISPRVVQSLQYADSDFFSHWLAARMSWNNQNPYDSNTWISGHQMHGADWVSDPAYLYPLPLSNLVAPLGLFPLFEAYTGWVFLSLLAILITVLMLRAIYDRTPPALNELVPLLIGAYLFRPVIITVRNGQLGAFILLLIIFSIYLWEREKWFAGGVVLGILIIKPNLGIPILIFVGLWALLSKRWQTFVGFFVSISVLFIIGWLRIPGWIAEYLKVTIEKGDQTLGFASSIWGLAGLFCKDDPNCVMRSGLVSTILIGGAVLIIFIRWKNTLAPRLAVSISIAAALLTTPYLWAYDQILLLIPLIIVIMEMKELEFPYLATAPFLLFFSLGSLLLILSAAIVGRDAWSAILSFFALIGIYWCLRRHSGRVPMNPT
jgi:hypothetical protein